MGLLNLLFNGNDREIAKMRKVAEVINGFEPALEALSDAEVRAKTVEFRQRLADGETLDDLLPEAFAVVREAGKRTVGMRHFDVQMIGGMVLHQGRIAEMKTGEGKTLVATLPLYLNALEGKGAHLVTTNDYLAKFHAQWMGGIYNFLGLTVGALQGSSIETGELEASYVYDGSYVNDEEPIYHNLRRCEKQEAYLADITYGTNHVYGFDYLRDNMEMSRDGLSQRDLHYAIVDEVDSILIDEARTPLIISGMPTQSSDLYQKMDRVIRRLVHEKDYTIDEKAKTAMFTDEGMAKVEQGLGVANLTEDVEMMHHANAALKAHAVFKNDVDYVVKDGQVIIVDEFTGRLMFGRRYSDGLHQAIEAKEGVKVEHENQTLATITYQNYFRLYDKLAGMTGTAKTEEEEFRKIYGLDVVLVPTNKPMVRIDHPDMIFKTEESKLRGISMEILRLHAKQQPVLVGTRSIEVSERLSDRIMPEQLQLLAAVWVLRDALDSTKDMDGAKRKDYSRLLNIKLGELALSKLLPLAKDLGIPIDMLNASNVQRLAKIMEITDSEQTKRLAECLADGIPHNVLNAKYHEREAQFIADAGRLGAVTIATNMAGRGVDILLGGKVEGSNADRNPEAEGVIKAGGLFIVGSERHESRRIDNQLRGRSGRQGDPGGSRFFVSLEDELWRVFGDKSNSPLLNSWQEELAMDSKFLSKMIERTQKKMESHYFEMRKHVLNYDDVMNVQRETIYGQRRQILEGADLKPTILDFLHKSVTNAVNTHCPEVIPPSEWDTAGLFQSMNEIFPLELYVKQDDLNGKKPHEIEELLTTVVDRTYEDKESQLGSELMREIERHIALRSINERWVEHLDAMDYLREGIGLRGYAQIDPLVAYKKEAYEMFGQMLGNVQDDIVHTIYRVQVQVEEQQPAFSPYRNLQMFGGDYPAPESDFGYGMGGPQETGPMPAPTPMGVSVASRDKVGRNDPCPCGSGKKYKKCCGS